MKLDSEEQRNQLTEMINAFTFNVTAETIGSTKKMIDDLLGAIGEAEIEELQPDIQLKEVE